MERSRRSDLTTLIKHYLSEERQLTDQIAQTGRIPEEITELSYCDTLRYIEEISVEHQLMVEKFLAWKNQFDVPSPDFQVQTIFNEESEERMVATVDDGERERVISIPSDPDMHTLFSDFLPRYKPLPLCDHLSFDGDMETLEENARLLVEERRNRGSYRREKLGQGSEDGEPYYEKSQSLIFACGDCVAEENKSKCDCLSYNGFSFDDGTSRGGKVCGWRRGLFKQAVEESGFKVQDLGKAGESYTPEFKFYVPELGALVTDNIHSIDERMVEQLTPSVIVVFGEKKNVLDVVKYNRDALIVSSESNSVYYFDSDRIAEDDDSTLIGRIITDVDEYAEAERGKEHTRIQNALLQLGKEEGYIVEDEYTISGLTVDAIWFKRNGNDVKLAAEIETTAGWKKDLLSLWESEADIALLITTNHKTNKVAEDLAEFHMLDYLPYKLVYINLGTEDVYIFEQGELLGQFVVGENIGGDLEGEGYRFEDI